MKESALAPDSASLVRALTALRHDVRNPLLVIVGFAELLEERRDDDATRREASRVILAAARELERTIDELEGTLPAGLGDEASS